MKAGPGSKAAKRQVQASLDAQRARLGITRYDEYRGLRKGDPVRLKKAGTGQRILEFHAYFVGPRGEWVDVVDVDTYRREDGKVGRVTQIIPVRPEQVVVVRS